MPAKYDFLYRYDYRFGDRLRYAVKLSDKEGYLTNKGELSIPANHDYIGKNLEGNVRAFRDGKVAIYDVEGRLIHDYREMTESESSFLKSILEPDPYNDMSEEIAEFPYETRIYKQKSGDSTFVIEKQDEKGWEVKNELGKLILPHHYSDFNAFRSFGELFFMQNHKNEQWGYVNADGIEFWNDSLVNKALEATVSSSSGEGVSKINDGFTMPSICHLFRFDIFKPEQTGWTNFRSSWINFNFSKPQAISKIVVVFCYSIPVQKYEIQVRNNSKDEWKTVLEIEGNDRQSRIHTIDQVVVSDLRVVFSEEGLVDDFIQVQEVEIYE